MPAVGDMVKMAEKMAVAKEVVAEVPVQTCLGRLGPARI